MKSRIKQRSNTSVSRRKFIGRSIAVSILAGAAPIARATTELWREGDPQCRVLVSSITPIASLRDSLGDFIGLSQALTGESQLDPRLGWELMRRFASNPLLTNQLLPMIRTYQDISASGAPNDTVIAKRIMDSKSAHRTAAEQLIYLWYFSAFFLPPDNDPVKAPIWIYSQEEHTEKQYAKGLVWSLTSSHAPMTDGGKPKYWAEEP